MIVVWRVTERCNLSCPFCAYDRRLPGARRELEMQTVERFAGVLGDYRRTTGERVLLSWLGGEPLLWPPVFELSRRLHRDFGIDISATTNGTTLSSPVVRGHILDCFAELTVSVDGLADFHENLRAWPGGWPRLRAAIQALARERSAAGARLRLRANVVLMHDNLSMFADLCDALTEWGVDEITFNQLGGRDRPEFFQAHRLRPQDTATLSALVPPLAARLSARGVRLCGGEQYLERIDASAQGRRLAVDDCAPGERFLFIDEHNRIAPCSFTVNEFGFPLETISSVEALNRMRESYVDARIDNPSTACGDCPSTQVFAKFAI